LEEGEERLHTFEVELDMVRLFHQPPDLLPAFWQATSYYISFHPTSEPVDSITLPPEAPKVGEVKQGEFMVSKIAKATKPLVQLHSYGRNAVVAQFLENMSLLRPHIDIHLAGYVWGVRSSVFSGSEDAVLIGRLLLPLTDWSLQRRVVPWSITDIPTGQRVGEIVIKYQVLTTPSAPVKPRVSDVMRHEVTLHWSPPENDHGSPVIGYKIDVLLERKNKDPQWATICQCTDGTEPSYIVTGLQPHTPYVFEVSAINGVGVGDVCEFEIHTAAVEPSPPPKPWMKKKREDNICIAWYHSPYDGGAPVFAYKLVMHMVPGASRWNFFSSKEATEIEIAIVNVQGHPHEFGPEIFSHWVEVQEEQCEYKFQVFAMNATGISEGSELSNAHYA